MSKADPMENPFNSNTIAGTAGGTLLVIVLRISVDEILHTVILGGIGAVISFAVSLLMKQFVRWCRRK